jgi:hypothetical protein
MCLVDGEDWFCLLLLVHAVDRDSAEGHLWPRRDSNVPETARRLAVFITLCAKDL